MEFAEYYRIIRRRGWIAVVLALLTTSMVVAARLMPKREMHPAVSRVLVHEVAQRQVRVVGDELRIGGPERADRFWEDLAQFARRTNVLERAAADIGVLGGEAQDRFQVLHARRVGNSNVLEMVVGADSKETAVKLCNATVQRFDNMWRERQVQQAHYTRETLEARVVTLRAKVKELEAAEDELSAKHAGSEPPLVLERLNGELTLLTQQTANVQISLGTAEARNSILQGEPGGAEQASIPVLPSQRATALRQVILETQIALDIERTRRTAEHPDVQAIEAEIAMFEQRLAAVEEEERSAPSGIAALQSPELQQAALEARINAGALERQLGLLQQRAGDIHERLPGVRDDARVFMQMNNQLTVAKQKLDAAQKGIEVVHAVEEEFQTAAMLEVLQPAIPQRLPRGFVALAMKLTVALLAGAGLGILIIFLIHYVDLTFQDEEEAEKLLGVRVLAGIPRSDVKMPVPPTSSRQSSSQS